MARGQGQTGRAPILTLLQYEQVENSIQPRPFRERDRSILAVSFYLGLRAKEIASLKIEDVYAADGSARSVVHIKRSYTKKNRMRDVYVSAPNLRTALERYWVNVRSSRPDSPLFPTRSGRHFTPNGMVHLFRDVYMQAGIKASSHSGRRTLITRLAEQGVDLKAIATLAGHSSISTTCIYIENNPERLSKIMSQVAIV
ncbi:site-specific integrase [Terrihabitans soli]|uniref:tyrosine-type recombinase/integrase n=1 Tax=Terrihabitans soli TaxID=708113 RepID=UPI001CA37673